MCVSVKYSKQMGHSNSSSRSFFGNYGVALIVVVCVFWEMS
jgi:hypothetical protein